MSARPTSRSRSIAGWITLALLALLITASLLPLVETDLWWIRFLDFPRLQFAAAIVILLGLFLLLSRSLPASMLAGVAALLALGYHAWKLHPYFDVRIPENPVARSGDIRSGVPGYPVAPSSHR